MEQNQNNDESKRNPTECNEGADQPLLSDVDNLGKCKSCGDKLYDYGYYVRVHGDADNLEQKIKIYFHKPCGCKFDYRVFTKREWINENK